VSADLINEFGPSGGVIDVGAGASVLVDQLLHDGRTDVSLLDVSAEGLSEVRERLGDGADSVSFIVTDLLTWQPERQWAVWHDRALFHFLTNPDDRTAYLAVAAEAVATDGVIVIGTFAEDGPEQCSGLPAARYDSSRLTELFSENFAVMTTIRDIHRTPWGSKQPFTWAVLQRR
jgi:uncharacterized UPF0146 family protein